MKKLAARSLQKVMSADFTFNHNDWVVDSADGVKKTFGSTVALSVDPAESGLTGPVANVITFDAIPLPPGAVVVGGELIIETAGVGPTAYTMTLGIAGALTSLLASTSLLGAAGTRAALLLTSALQSVAAGANMRMVVEYTVARATAGKFRVRIEYVIDGKADEIQIA